MSLTKMRQRIREDLKDIDNERWSDDELNRHIDHAVRDFSQALPLEAKATKATTKGSRIIDISSLSNYITIYAVEYPIDHFPPKYQRFSVFQDTITLLGDEIPDGSNCCIYYGKLHTIDASTSTIPPQYEDMVATGAEAYALLGWAAYSINRVSIGGRGTPEDFRRRGEELLARFNSQLKRLKSRLRPRRLYLPATPPLSKTTDWGP